MKQESVSRGNEEFSFICNLIAMAHKHRELDGKVLVERVGEIFGEPKRRHVPEDLVARIRAVSPDVMYRSDFFFPYGEIGMPMKDEQYWNAVRELMQDIFY